MQTYYKNSIMKKIIIITFLFAITNLLVADTDIYQEIAAAVRSGNSKEVAKYFNTNVDLTILTQEDTYSKTQAELIIKDFFEKNTPKSFILIHQGTSKEGAMYAIGTLVTTQRVTLRTSFFIKQTSGKYYIRELRFEKD